MGRKKEDKGRTAEGEKAFFVAFGAGTLLIGFIDRSDTCGTNFKEEHFAEMLAIQLTNGAFIFREDIDIFFNCHWVDGVEPSADPCGFSCDAVARKMVAVVISRA